MLLPMMLLVLMVMGMDLRLEQGRAMTAMTLLPLLSLPLLLMVGKQGKLVLLPMFLPLLMDMLERKNQLIYLKTGLLLLKRNQLLPLLYLLLAVLLPFLL